MNNKIYIIKNGKRPIYKIGLSKSPRKRIKEMQTGNPEKLNLLFTRKIADRKTENEVRNTLLNTDAYEQADGGSEWIIKKYEHTKIIDDVNHAIRKCETNKEKIDHTYVQTGSTVNMNGYIKYDDSLGIIMADLKKINESLRQTIFLETDSTKATFIRKNILTSYDRIAETLEQRSISYDEYTELVLQNNGRMYLPIKKPSL